MRKKFSLILSISLLALLALSSCSLSLAGDIPPPPGYQPPVYEEPEMLTGTAPESAPNPENGRLIYAEKCEACHGSTGLGDGPDSTALPNEVARIGAANVVNLASPLKWYSITMQGNIERFMPLFEASLSPADTWDVLAYVYTFSADQDVVAYGGEVYDETCTACHSEDGSGSGMPGAANFLDAERMVLLSLEDIVQKAATGNGDVNHVFSNQLDADEIEAVALFVRSLNFPLEGELVEEVAEEPAVEDPAEDEQASEEVPAPEEPEVGYGTVTGQVTNGSGGELPEGLEVQLEVYESFDMVFSESVSAADDGTYLFEDVLLDPELIYITLVETSGTFFPSAFHMGEQTIGDTIDLPITIYDLTSDTKALTSTRLHVFFQFTSEGTVQVIHQVSISNRGNKMVAPDRDTEPVLNFKLPEGASNLIFQAGTLGNPYVETVDGFADPTPIMPGENVYEILFAYELPFDNKMDWALSLDLPTDVAVLFVEGETLKVQSENLEPGGMENLDQGVFQVMIGNGFSKGQMIDVQLSAPLFEGSASALTQNRWFTIVLGVIGIGLAGFGAWRFFAPVKDDEGYEADRESLINEIIALDEKYEAGQLEEEKYRVEREELKSDLKRLLDEENAR